MIDIEEKFEKDGFVVIDKIMEMDELRTLKKTSESHVEVKVGTRNLLKHSWVKALAQMLIANPSINRLLPKSAVSVQCNYFSKDTTNNWCVTLHRDLSIPVKSKVSAKGWSGWSKKENTLYAQPPKHVLADMVAVRIHLEDNNSENGALEIVAGSHKNLNQKGKRHPIFVAQGSALVMRPLALHSSTKLKSGKRRVLHFVFGPEKLPNNAEWANAL